MAENEITIEKLDKELEQIRLDKMQPIYRERDQYIGQIPSFWKIVLSQHSNFANFIRASDFKYIDLIDNVNVEWENVDNFTITIKFNELDGDFPEQTVSKKFRLVTIENDLKSDGKDNEDDDEEEEEDEIERLVSEPVDIIWPKSYDHINPNLITDKKTKEGKRNYKTGMKTIFGWFKWTGLKPGKEFPNGDSLAELFSQDLYPYCVKYYTEAQRDLEDEYSDDEELDEIEQPLDISEDEDEDEEHKSKKQRV